MPVDDELSSPGVFDLEEPMSACALVHLLEHVSMKIVNSLRQCVHQGGPTIASGNYVWRADNVPDGNEKAHDWQDIRSWARRVHGR